MPHTHPSRQTQITVEKNSESAHVYVHVAHFLKLFDIHKYLYDVRCLINKMKKIFSFVKSPPACKVSI